MYFQELISKALKEIESAVFDVTDLLRGKCLFNKISDINSAGLRIK